jgi:hypothetical protein
VLVEQSARIDARLRRYRPPDERWSAWQREEPELEHLNYADVRRLLLDRTCPPDHKDALLLALVRRAHTDLEAVVCVGACLYPGLSRIAYQYREILDSDDAWSSLAEALTSHLRSYNPERCNHFVAANLLRQSAHLLRRVVRLERMWKERVQLQEELVVEMPSLAPDDNDPLADGAPLAALDIALIRATRFGGLSLLDAASLLGLSYEAAKKRRQRAEAIWARDHARTTDLTSRPTLSRCLSNAAPGDPSSNATQLTTLDGARDRDQGSSTKPANPTYQHY